MLALVICAKCDTAHLLEETVITRLFEPGKDRAVCLDCYMSLEWGDDVEGVPI